MTHNRRPRRYIVTLAAPDPDDPAEVQRLLDRIEARLLERRVRRREPDEHEDPPLQLVQ